MGEAGGKDLGSAFYIWLPQHREIYLHIAESNEDEASAKTNMRAGTPRSLLQSLEVEFQHLGCHRRSNG